MSRMRKVPVMVLGAILLAQVPGMVAMAKTKVSFMCWTTSNADTTAFKKLVTVFEKEHPDIQVKLIAENWAGELPYFSKYLAMATAGVAPDIINIPYNYLPNFAEANLIDDLGPWVKKSKIKLTDYTEAGIQAGSWKGRLWGMNAGTGGDFWVFYNKKVLAESGVVDPGTLASKGDWTLDNMEMIMAKATRFDGTRLNRIGYMQMAEMSHTSAWIYAMGGRIMDSEGVRSTLDEPAAVAGVQRMWDNVFKRRIMGLAWAPPYNIDLVTGAKKQQFGMLGWWNTVGTYLVSNKIPWTIDMVPFPAGPKEPKDNVATIHSVCLSKQGKQKAAAWEFVRFLSGTKGQTIYAEELQGMPTLKSLTRRFGAIYREQGFPGGDLFVEDAMARLRPMDRSAKYDRGLTKMLEGLNRIWTGKADVAQTLKDTAKAATQELSRGRKK